LDQPAINNKKPPTIQEFTRALKGIGLEAKRKRVGEWQNDKKVQWYSASFKDLYATFLKKNMIDEAENIDEPEGYEHKENKYTHPIEKFPEEPKDSLKESKAEKNEKSELEPLKIVPKKSPPPIPSKPDHLKVNIKSSNNIPKPESSKKIDFDAIMGELQDYIKEIEEPKPELDPASIPLPESPKMELVSEPKPKDNIDENLEILYKGVKEAWERAGEDPDDFDWEVCAVEIEDLPNYVINKSEIDRYHSDLVAIMRSYQYKSNNGMGLNRSFCEEIAQEIREYEKKRRIVQVIFDIPPLEIESSIIKQTKETIGISDNEDEDDELDDLVEEMN
jgi:hypothetical protein